jgi:hypothetical protein
VACAATAAAAGYLVPRSGSASIYCILKTYRKHIDCSWRASIQTTFCAQVVHDLWPRMAPPACRNVSQDVTCIQCVQRASGLSETEKSNRSCQTPELVKSSTRSKP